MRRLGFALVGCAISVSLLSAAQRTASRGQAGRGAQMSAQCAAPLGQGVKSSRQFCDVLITQTPADSVIVTIPARSGTATLLFDLHARFSVTSANTPQYIAYAQHLALVTVIRPNGTVIGRGVVNQTYRSPLDLFDQISGGGGPGGAKGIAPGKVEPVSITIPTNVNTVGIVGVTLTVTNRLGEQTSDAPGTPIAIVSNIRLTYTPGRQ
jgi:hypothetical protein